MELPVDEQEYSYDVVPYQSRPFRQSHPDRLATVATLAGLTPPSVLTCRMLELGCAAGGNLIPLAVAYPEAKFVGVDLSAKQVTDGQQTIAALGLANIELRHLDMTAVGTDLGSFHYIVSHGVYSWVPPEVQDRMLAVCAERLAPDGVAYISYNTLPGWRMRSIVRDMMYFHGRRFTSPKERVGHAKALLEFVVKSLESQTSPYANMLRAELKLVQSVSDSYLFHEHLEKDNHPSYFHEFIDNAGKHGLRYLGEADAFTMAPRTFPQNVQNVLKKLSPDILYLEQYMDFLRNRMFRQTLLCHANVTPKYQLSPRHAEKFRVASPLRPVSATPDIKSQASEQFKGPNDVTLTSPGPVVKAAVMCLMEQWPRPVLFKELLTAVADKLGMQASTHGKLVDPLSTFVLNTYTTSNVLDLSVTEPRFTFTPGDKPVASPLARHQAATGKVLTNLRHETVSVGDAERQMTRLLDGTLDRAALASRIGEMVDQGVLAVRRNNEPVQDKDEARKIVGESVDRILTILGRAALLVA